MTDRPKRPDRTSVSKTRQRQRSTKSEAERILSETANSKPRKTVKNEEVNRKTLTGRGRLSDAERILGEVLERPIVGPLEAPKRELKEPSEAEMRSSLQWSIQNASGATVRELFAFASKSGFLISEDVADPLLEEVRQAKVPHWPGRGSPLNPALFIKTHYKVWLDDKRLRRDVVHHYDPPLVDAYRKWVGEKRHPEDAIEFAPSRKLIDPRAVTESGHIPSGRLSDESREARNRRGRSANRPSGERLHRLP